MQTPGAYIHPLLVGNTLLGRQSISQDKQKSKLESYGTSVLAPNGDIASPSFPIQGFLCDCKGGATVYLGSLCTNSHYTSPTLLCIGILRSAGERRGGKAFAAKEAHNDLCIICTPIDGDHTMLCTKSRSGLISTLENCFPKA